MVPIIVSKLSADVVKKHASLQGNKQDQDIDSLLQANDIAYDAYYAGEQTGGEWPHDAWCVEFTKDKQKFISDFSTGIGLRYCLKKMSSWHRGYDVPLERKRWKEENSQPVSPFAASVLYSVLIDGEASEYSFEEWCCNFGYDTDSRKALETYLKCQQIGNDVGRFFGINLINEFKTILQDY